MVSQNDTITSTLRLYDPSVPCWYDTVISVVVTAPEGNVHHDTICEGESIVLDASRPFFSEGFSAITHGNDNSSSGSSYAYSHDPLDNFPVYSDYVYQAGGHVRIGKDSVGGYITSKPIDLSQPYTVKLWLRGWNRAVEQPHFFLKVDGNTVMEEDIPIGAWDGAYDYYNDSSSTAATATSTITIGNSGMFQRFFLDSVAVVYNTPFQYAWNTGATTSNITVSPSNDATYYVTVTPEGGCAQVDTFYVVVKQKPVVTFNPCGGTCATTSMQMECQHGVTLPSATPCASDYVFAGWSTEPVDSAVTTEPSPLYLAGENYLSTTDTTLFAVYRKCTPTGGSKYKKVTSDTSDWTGEYLIAYTAGNKVFDGSLSTLDAASNYQPVTVSNGEIGGSCQPYSFTINPQENNTYSIQSTSGKYIGKESDSNGLNETDVFHDNKKNSISYSNGNIDIVGVGGAHLRFNNASNGQRFSYYKSTTYTNQQSIQLYRSGPEEACEWWSWPTCNPVINIASGIESDGHDWGCIAPTDPVFTVTDDCNGTFSLPADSVTVTGPTHDGCNYTQTWTAHYTDPCGTQADEVSVTYTWKVGVTPTITTELALNQDLGCTVPTRCNPIAMTAKPI